MRSPVGGLEVFHRETDTWYPVKVVKDAFVVNIGDMLGELRPVEILELC